MFEENPQETPERLEELERRKEALDQAIIVEEANIYDKDKVELQEVSEDELFEFVGVEVFDNFVTCSTETLNVNVCKVFLCPKMKNQTM